MDLIGVEVFAIGGQVPRTFGIEKAEILSACDPPSGDDRDGLDTSAG